MPTLDEQITEMRDCLRSMEVESREVIVDVAKTMVESPVYIPERPRGLHSLYLAAVGRAPRSRVSLDHDSHPEATRPGGSPRGAARGGGVPMTDVCGAPHPERALSCESVGTHADHAAWTKDEGHVFWPNTDYVAPPPPVPAGRGRGAAETRLHGLAQKVPPKTSSGGGRPTQTQDEGMASSFASIKDDLHNWPIVQEVIRQACALHAEVSTNEVWDLLLTRSDYTYGGDRGYMGSILYNWAQKQGLVGKPLRKVSNRQPWGHSNEGVNVYPSLLHGRVDA